MDVTEPARFPDLVFPLPPRPVAEWWDPAATGPDTSDVPYVVLPGWVRDAHPAATGWQPVGDRQWRATMPGLGGARATLLVVVGATGAAHYLVDLDVEPGEMIPLLFEKLQADIAYHELPACNAPDCDEKAPIELTVAELGHFAGVMRSPGDRIRLCHPHYDDVRTAAYGDLDRVADWLRPAADARTASPFLLTAVLTDVHDALTLHRDRPQLPYRLHPEGTT